jgi:hypothetical protein
MATNGHRNIKVCACGAPWEHKDGKRDEVPNRPSHATMLDEIAGFDGRRGLVPVPLTGSFTGPANPEFCPTPKVIWIH